MSAKMKPPTATILKSTPTKTQLNDEVKLFKRSVSTNTDTPSPLEFAKFLPWVCLQFEISVEVTVRKAIAEKHVSRRKTSNASERKSSGRVKSSDRKAFSSGGLKPAERKVTSQPDVQSTKKTFPPSAPEKAKSSSPYLQASDKIPITAYYDPSGHLVEIAIIKSPVKIHQKTIKCINMCLPFHPSLLKFTITNGGLTSDVLYELAKLLPFSYITDVCLDDCYIKEGNYYILLDNISSLKVLSLKRCKINDLALKEITKRLDMEQPASGLTVLDLGSNQITDRGVWYLGDILRRNRSLLHLCLSNNKITDMGLKYIMNPLKEFQMNQEEIYGLRKRRFQFLERIGISKQEEAQGNHKNDVSNQGTQVHFRGKPARRRSIRKKKQSAQDLCKVSAVPVFQREEFTDLFDDHNVIKRDCNMYCFGNFTLCSLNLAYNELDYMSIRRIFDVVLYQSKIMKAPPRNGLMRLVLEGNFLPDCDELHEIGLHLSLVISSVSQSTRILRSRSKF